MGDNFTIANPAHYRHQSARMDSHARSKFSEKIQYLLQQCREASQSRWAKQGTRWQRGLAILGQFFPDGKDLPFARVSTPKHPIPDADVWYIAEDELIEHVACRGRSPTPIVVKAAQNSDFLESGLEDFLGLLDDHFRGADLDVQDMHTTRNIPVKMPVDSVIERILAGIDLPNGRLPINLLNLKFLGQAPPGPSFLNTRRFALIPAINSRMEAEWTGEAIGGKRTQATRSGSREVDLVGSMTFSLFAQRGSMTGFHVDVPDGTWVRNCWGLKLWIFPENFDHTDAAGFKEMGPDWVPAAVRFVVLEPGDTLIMPAGQIVPHAVLTLEDSHMVGGMFLDGDCLLGSLRKLLWVTENPNVSNEAIPFQLIAGWHHLRDIYIARNQSQADIAEFDALTRRLQTSLSCVCPGPCGKACNNCPCAHSIAQDGQCTAWCHLSKMRRNGALDQALGPAKRQMKPSSMERDSAWEELSTLNFQFNIFRDRQGTYISHPQSKYRLTTTQFDR